LVEMSMLDQVFDANFCCEPVAAKASSLFNTCVKYTDSQHLLALAATISDVTNDSDVGQYKYQPPI